MKALELEVVPVFLAEPCTPAPTAPAPGLPGAPVFLLNRLLKKLASTPSLAAPAVGEMREGVVVVRELVYKYTHIIHFVSPPKISLSCVIEDKSSSLPITEWCLAQIWELFIFLFKQNILQCFILKELCSYKPRKKLFNIVNRLTLKN